MPTGPRVVKVGGSLFARPRLGDELAAFLRSLPPARTLVVAGGGALADAVRALDATHKLGDEASHWLALRSLQASADFVEHLLRRANAPPCEVVDLWAFARADEARPGRLPHTWDVTTDSLAARVAIVEGAGEVILLKSAEPPAGDDWNEAARRGYVDRVFPDLTAAWGGDVRAIDFPFWAACHFGDRRPG